MAFQKGRSGNPGGRVKDRPWTDALRLAVNEADAGGKKKLRALADKCVADALEGNMQAIVEIGNRLDGKPVQESTVTVQRQRASEISDDELADIAVGSGEGVDPPPLDPSQLN